MATYNSLDELVKAIKKAHKSTLKDLSEETKETIKDTMRSKRIGQKYRLENSLKVENLNSEGYQVTFKKGAGHTSELGQASLGISPGDEVYVPYWVDKGYSWNSSGAGFVDEAQNKIKQTTASRYEELLMKKL